MKSTGTKRFTETRRQACKGTQTLAILVRDIAGSVLHAEPMAAILQAPVDLNDLSEDVVHGKNNPLQQSHLDQHATAGQSGSSIATHREQPLSALQLSSKHFATVMAVSQKDCLIALGFTDFSLRFLHVMDKHTHHGSASSSKCDTSDIIFTQIGQLHEAHSRRIRDLIVHSGNVQAHGTAPAAALVLSASEDGRVCCSVPSLLQEYEGVASSVAVPDKKHAWSIALGLPYTSVLAVGTDDTVEFYWLKHGVSHLDDAEHIGSFEESFYQPVTQLSFHPTQPGILFASSSDGLVSVFDVHDELDDWDGVQAILSVGADIACFGFFGMHNECVWCITRVEELSLWDAEGGWVGQLRSADPPMSTRDTLSSVHPLQMQFLYLVGAEYDAECGTLYLSASTQYSYELDVFPVLFTGADMRPQVFQPVVRLRNGHSDVIRLVESLNTDSWNRIEMITAGEDGVVALWGPEVAT